MYTPSPVYRLFSVAEYSAIRYLLRAIFCTDAELIELVIILALDRILWEEGIYLVTTPISPVSYFQTSMNSFLTSKLLYILLNSYLYSINIYLL